MVVSTKIVDIQYSVAVTCGHDCLRQGVRISIRQAQIRPVVDDVSGCDGSFCAASEVKLFTIPSGSGARTCEVNREATVRPTPGVEVACTCEVQNERSILDVDLIDTVVVVEVAARREVLASAV